jgi:hypothetical protein
LYVCYQNNKRRKSVVCRNHYLTKGVYENCYPRIIHQNGVGVGAGVQVGGGVQLGGGVGVQLGGRVQLVRCWQPLPPATSSNSFTFSSRIFSP